MQDSISESFFEGAIFDRYFNQLDASLICAFYLLILNSCYNNMRRTDLDLEAISIIGVIIFKFE
jgi:hypothetical protein